METHTGRLSKWAREEEGRAWDAWRLSGISTDHNFFFFFPSKRKKIQEDPYVYLRFWWHHSTNSTWVMTSWASPPSYCVDPSRLTSKHTSFWLKAVVLTRFIVPDKGFGLVRMKPWLYTREGSVYKRETGTRKLQRSTNVLPKLIDIHCISPFFLI